MKSIESIINNYTRSSEFMFNKPKKSLPKISIEEFAEKYGAKLQVMMNKLVEVAKKYMADKGLKGNVKGIEYGPEETYLRDKQWGNVLDEEVSALGIIRYDSFEVYEYLLKKLSLHGIEDWCIKNNTDANYHAEVAFKYMDIDRLGEILNYELKTLSSDFQVEWDGDKDEEGYFYLIFTAAKVTQTVRESYSIESIINSGLV